MAINITSAEQANALDTQNRYNTLSGLSSQMAANDPNQLRLQRKMQGLASAGAVQNTSVGAVADSFVNKPITSSMLSSNVAPINLPTPTPPSTAGAGLSGEVTAKITNDYTNLANELKTAQDRAQQQVDNTKSTLLGKIGVSSQAITDKMAEYQKPEFLAKQKAVNDAYAEVQKLDAAQRSELEALNAQGLTGAGSQAAQAGISRKYSLARANLAVVYDIARGDLQSTIENIDRTAALKQEAVQPYIDYYSKILDGDLSAFTKAEQNTLQLRLSEYQRKQDDISQVGEILKTAVANGVKLSSQDVAKINSFENPNDALGYLASRGISLAKPVSVGGVDSASVEYYSQLLAEGKITLSNVPQSVRNAVVANSQGIINKLLSDTALTKINDTNFAISSLTDLRAKIQTNLGQLGPVTGLEALNPYSEKRKLQADIDRVRQTVGKALEGGVLRKEDEEKYKKILATITDTPETALYKIDALISSIQRNIEDYKSLQSESGRFVPTKSGTEEDLRSKYNY